MNPRFAITTLALLAILPGCIVRTDLAATVALADGSSRAAPASDAQWPELWAPEDAEPGSPHGIVIPLEGPLSTWRGVHLGEHHYLHASDTERADAARLATALDRTDGFQFRAEGPGSFVFVRDPRYTGPDARPAPEPGASDPAELFKVVFAWPDESWNGLERVHLERSWVALYDPTDRAKDESKGQIVLLPGMFGTPEPMIDSLTGTLRRQGWTVLRFLSHNSRFTERIEATVSPSDTDRVARSLASQLARRAAGCAYAVDLALDHAARLRPQLAGKPTALMGMSGGALVAPTVHAYEPGRFDAVVLFAGGVNFLEINLRSNYADWIDAIVLDFDADAEGVQRPSAEQILDLSRQYLDHAPLDGHHLAPLLAGKPTLIVQASGDKAVPADLGERLWNLAGRPERWTLPVGHELVFAALPFQAPAIERWLTSNLLEPDATETPAASGADDS
ncbi:MAG: alpha/beta hydrolase family protein [Phycisphaerales bacterium JB040]